MTKVQQLRQFYLQGVSKLCQNDYRGICLAAFNLSEIFPADTRKLSSLVL